MKDTKIQLNHHVGVEFTWDTEGEASGRLTVSGRSVLVLRGEPNTVKRAVADALQRLAFDHPAPAYPVGYHGPSQGKTRP